MNAPRYIKLLLLLIPFCGAVSAQIPWADSVKKYHVTKILIHNITKDTSDLYPDLKWLNDDGYVYRETSFFINNDSTGIYVDSAVTVYQYDDKGRIIHFETDFAGLKNTHDYNWTSSTDYTEHSVSRTNSYDLHVRRTQRMTPFCKVYIKRVNGKVDQKQIWRNAKNKNKKQRHWISKSRFTVTYITEYLDDSGRLSKTVAHSRRHRHIPRKGHYYPPRKYSYTDQYEKDNRGLIIKHTSYSTVDHVTNVYRYEYITK